MEENLQQLRAYVVGTGDEQKNIHSRLIELSGDEIFFCFGTLEQSLADLASGLRGNTAYNCVLFLISVSKEQLPEVFKDFQKVCRQGIPTYAVPIFDSPASTEHESAARLVPESEYQASDADERLSTIKRMALRLGAAGVITPQAPFPLPSYLRHSIRIQEKAEQLLSTLEDPESYIIELQRSELRYRNLVQLSRDLIWSVDAEGRWTFMNDAVFEILGYQAKEMIGRRFTEFQDPQDAARDLITFSKVLEGNKYFDYETRYLTKTGSKVTLSFNALVIFDEQGIATGATGTAMDISSQKRAAEDLKSQKEFFRQVVDANPNRISVRNLCGQFVLANQAFAKTLRYDPDDLIGLTYQEVLSDPRSLKLLNMHDAQLKADPNQEIIFERREASTKGAKGESWFQTIRKALLLPNHREPYLLEVSVDLTERKRSEEALRHVVEGTAGATAADYFPSLLEHLTSALQMPAGIIYQLDEKGSMFSTVARSPEGLCENSLTLLIDNALFDRLIRDEFVCIPAEADTVLPAALTGKYSTLLGSLLKNARGEPIGMLIVFGNSLPENRDLAEYMLTLFGERASAELARMTSETETKRLERQLLQAQKMEAIGTLAAGVAHDLNNALGAVTGHLQLLEGSEMAAADHKQSLQIALDGCSRASRLVHQLLGFSRQGKYVPENITLRDSLEEMIEFLNCATRKDVVIEIKEIAETLSIRADKNQFQQVLMNLIINAQQAMPTGGTITIKAESQIIRLPQQYNSKAAQGEYTVIEVRDTGTGIEKAIQDKIFEPFFTTKPAQMGTGLGLSMVYGIMQHHGGWVDVNSTVGEGSIFRIYFPNTFPTDKSDIAGSAKPLIQPSILVIDDEPFLVDLTCRFLERSGFIARGFTDPNEALRYFESNKDSIHLTILDMKMPQLDGKSCFLKLRKIDPNVQVVILSGFIQDDAARAVMEEGALRYFHKPLKYSELIDWVKVQFQEDPGLVSV